MVPRRVIAASRVIMIVPEDAENAQEKHSRSIDEQTEIDTAYHG